mgnify:CR=1 FL=1
MTTSRVVRVAVESPMPQLDRLFDYLVPDKFEDQNLVGCRVQVPFGKGKNLKSGYVVDYLEHSEVANKLSEIATVVSEAQVLPLHIYKLLRAVADRQAVTFNDLQKLAIPARSVKVEKAWLEARSEPSTHTHGSRAEKTSSTQVEPDSSKIRFSLAEPRITKLATETGSIEVSGWMSVLIEQARDCLTAGKSVIAVVPDFRDRARLRQAFVAAGLHDYLADFESDATPSTRYAEFLKCLDGSPRLIFGSRIAIYAPAENLGAILVFDEADQSLIEQSSPYIATREIALIRQQIQQSELHFVSNSVSCEMQRLLELGYLTSNAVEYKRPKIAYTEADERVDATAYQAIRSSLQSNLPVLIQVASRGNSVATYCAQCSERANCKKCNGPVEFDPSHRLKCRWCGALNLDYKCSNCNATKLRQGRAGSTRTASELGRAFPGAKLYEAAAGKQVVEVPTGKSIVVATPGTEPYVEGGYGAVILLDAKVALNRDTLRAREQAIRQWANAISFASSEAQVVLVGVSQNLGSKFALWKLHELASEELATRRELKFPPALRLASVTSAPEVLARMIDGLEPAVRSRFEERGKPSKHVPFIEILGPLPSSSDSTSRALIRFDYSLGIALAAELRFRNLNESLGSRTGAHSGRVTRAVRIKLDEPEVV